MQLDVCVFSHLFSSVTALYDVRFNLIDNMLVGLVIEEITEEVENAPSGNSVEHTVGQPKKPDDSSKSCSAITKGNLKTNTEDLNKLKNDPEAIR